NQLAAHLSHHPYKSAPADRLRRMPGRQQQDWWAVEVPSFLGELLSRFTRREQAGDGNPGPGACRLTSVIRFPILLP
ncbi:MAG: hypothetical protein MI807_10560, partial [Verrucomicrobiales bacterium]|nr:hypothetical protein [Verrucomicrobiales bacterium]